MKRILKEIHLKPDCQGLHANYRSVDEESPALEIPVRVPIPEGETAGVETRNQAKAAAIKQVQALLGDTTEVEILLS